jgi:hypothetical protein
LPAIQRVKLGIDRISKEPNAVLSGRNVIKLIESLDGTVMRPDESVARFVVNRNPTAFSRSPDFVQEAGRCAIPASELAARLEIGLIYCIGDPRRSLFQVGRLVGNWSF